MTKTTLELEPGDRVQLPAGIVRTVAKVEPNGWLNYRNRPLFDVLYLEGRTPEWGHGNSASEASTWTVVA